jgi:hypothetical protein
MAGYAWIQSCDNSKDGCAAGLLTVAGSTTIILWAS